MLPWRPVASKDGPNARLHWSVRRRRAVDWQAGLFAACIEQGWPEGLLFGGFGYVVTVTVRQRRGPLMDDDNLAGCCKALRDGVARWLGVSDAPGGIEWRYESERGPDETVLTLRGPAAARGGGE